MIARERPHQWRVKWYERVYFEELDLLDAIGARLRVEHAEEFDAFQRHRLVRVGAQTGPVHGAELASTDRLERLGIRPLEISPNTAKRPSWSRSFQFQAKFA